MTPKASSGKQRQSSLDRMEPPAETDISPNNVAILYKEMDQLARLVKQSHLTDAPLIEKILSLHREFKTYVHAQFISQIQDQQDFRVKLSQLVCAQKQARFDPDVKIAATHMFEYLEKATDEERAERQKSVEYWRARTLLYEMNDIFQLNPSIKEKAILGGRKVYSELQARSGDWESDGEIAYEQRRIVREKVRYCACLGNELKRAGDVREARQLFEWLFDFTEKKLKKEGEFPCYGLRASLTYHLGSVYRILEQHSSAEDKYTETLELLYERAKRRGEGDPDDYLFTIRKQAMAIGIGFGWVNYTRGFLRRAENALATARSMLARSSDPVVPFYIDLLYGTIKRCRAGTDPVKLQAVIEILNLARNEFKDHRHQRYAARACWELCLTYILLGEYKAARKQLDVVAERADETNHPKWRTNVSIGLSRILRGEGDLKGALREAERAIQRAGECISILPKVDAYITLGECKLHAAEKWDQKDASYSAARSEFEEALRIMSEHGQIDRMTGLPSNPKIVAVCNLRIAQCYAREWDEDKAKQHFAEWETLRANVEHEWVRELASKVKAEIDSLSMNFTISANNKGEWNYTENVAKLRKWLLAQALRQSKKNYTDAAEILGVQRATLYQWQDNSRTQPLRARTNGTNGRYKNKGEKE